MRVLVMTIPFEVQLFWMIRAYRRHRLDHELFEEYCLRQLSRNYTDLSVNGLTSLGSAFYLTGDDGVIGVWHTLPVNISNEYRNLGVSPTENDVRKMLSRSGFPVVFYLHGNSFDRTHPHRVGLSNLLNDMNYHVVTFDYRECRRSWW